MNDPMQWITLGAAGVTGVAVVAVAGLKGWRDWIGLQRLLMERHDQQGGAAATPGARIELADLKERVRKLEAIAAGVDL